MAENNRDGSLQTTLQSIEFHAGVARQELEGGHEPNTSELEATLQQLQARRENAAHQPRDQSRGR